MADSWASRAEVDHLVKQLTEAAGSYSDGATLEGQASRAELSARAKALSRAVASPELTPHHHGLNMAELIAIRTFMRLRVLDAIPSPGSISLQQLSEATGVQPSLLERMARILVVSGFLDQTRADGGEYMHTKSSRAYLLHQPSPGHLFLAMYDEWFRAMCNFDEYLVENGQLQHAKEPDDPLRNPYTSFYKQPGTPVWAIMSQNPERFQTFQTGMAGIDLAIPVVGHFDFDLLRNTPEEASQNRIALVDVGGGHGAVLQKILSTYPALAPAACVLQDLPDVIALSRKSDVLPSDVQRQEHDFTQEQPIRGAKAYFMRMILHDYADIHGILILSRLAAAMAPDSRVLVCEMVLPPRVDEATFPAAVLDQAVMTMGGKERTEDGFRDMFDKAGLDLVKVWRVPGVPGACVEGRLRPSA